MPKSDHRKGPLHFMQMYGSDMKSKLTSSSNYQGKAAEAEKMVKGLNEHYSHIEELHKLIADRVMKDLKETSTAYVGIATTVNITKDSVSMVDVIAAIESLLPEPLREYMISQGKSPDDGWKLVIPMPMAIGVDLPAYVVASRYIAEPCFIKPNDYFRFNDFTRFEI